MRKRTNLLVFSIKIKTDIAENVTNYFPSPENDEEASSVQI